MLTAYLVLIIVALSIVVSIAIKPYVYKSIKAYENKQRRDRLERCRVEVWKGKKKVA